MKIMRRYSVYVVFLIAVCVLLIVQLSRDGGTSSSSRTLGGRGMESQTAEDFIASKRVPQNPHLANGVQLNAASKTHTPSQKRSVIFGKPKTSPPSPRTPLAALNQPTPDYITRPMRPPQFLHNDLVKSTEAILSAPWVAKLKQMLSASGEKKQITAVFANSDYTESVLNWLIASKVRLQPPLEDVIVFCLDKEIFNVLHQRDIPSIYINPDTVANRTRLNELKYQYRIWMARFVVYRLVNYLGHDIVSYDADAIVLRNPKSLFEEHRYSDIISSAGKFPFPLGRLWGFTTCMGVILFRSNPRTESLWESISANSNSYDDQVLLNTAYNQCNIHWQSKHKDIENFPIDGECTNGLRVTILPYSIICRHDCIDKKIYVWHNRSKKEGASKTSTAMKYNVWYLRRNWKNINKTLMGTEWLRSLQT